MYAGSRLSKYEVGSWGEAEVAEVVGGERSGVRLVVLGLALLYFEITAPRRSECFLDRNKRFSVYVHMRSRCSHC